MQNMDFKFFYNIVRISSLVYYKLRACKSIYNSHNFQVLLIIIITIVIKLVIVRYSFIVI